MSKKEGNIEEKKDKRTGLFTILLVVIILIVWLISPFFIQCYFNNWTTSGTFGDSFGAINSLFSGLALAGIIYTIYLQKIELELQRKESRETKIQSRTQSFENMFFNLFKIHQELRKEISFNTSSVIFTKSKKKIINGKQFFEFAHKDFIELWEKEYKEEGEFGSTPLYNLHISDYKYEKPNGTKKTDGKIINHTVEKHLKYITDLKYPIFWEKYANYLGDYFRNIYHILKFISTEKSREIKNNESKREGVSEKYRKYADILQSQMSYSELFFMFYNAQKYTKVKPYIKEFDFVENLTIKNLLHPKHVEFEGMGKIRKE